MGNRAIDVRGSSKELRARGSRVETIVPDAGSLTAFGDNLKTYGWVWLGVGIVLIVVTAVRRGRARRCSSAALP